MPALSEISNENKSASHDPPAKIQKVDVISTLQVKLLSDKATVPRRGSAKAAGYDLARFAQWRMYTSQCTTGNESHKCASLQCSRLCCACEGQGCGAH